MSSTDVQPSNGTGDIVTHADRVGQQTAVEQSRAVAEVQAAIVVAQQCPRSISHAIDQMREACRQPALAERAFYRFPRGGQTVSGESIHLARELARCWGNVQYGISEMRRDDDYGQSELQAWAWDVETNTRSSTTFIVPHKRDKRGGPERLVDMRDVYENNANNGARRLHEQIFNVVPKWFTEEAKELCSTTLQSGGGKPLAQRVADSVKAFEAKWGITVDQLERKLGRDRDRWTEHDIAQLTVTYKSLDRGEITVADEFDDPRVTADEIVASSGSATSPEAPETGTTEMAPAPEPPAEPDGDQGRNGELRGRLVAALRTLGADHPEYPDLWERMSAIVEDVRSDDAWDTADPGRLAEFVDEVEDVASRVDEDGAS